MNKETTARAEHDGDTIIRFGTKFWSGMAGLAFAPAATCLAFFWHLSDRVIILETTSAHQTQLIERQQKTLDQLDSNREGIATAISEIKNVNERIKNIENAVNK